MRGSVNSCAEQALKCLGFTLKGFFCRVHLLFAPDMVEYLGAYIRIYDDKIEAIIIGVSEQINQNDYLILSNYGIRNLCFFSFCSLKKV